MIARRLIAAAALAAAVVLIAVVFFGGTSLTLNVQFTNAGQLVKGGAVQIAGRKVGAIQAISLTPDGLADVQIKVDDGAVLPLHAGTRASIRAVGQAGVANRFVDLDPGPPQAARLRDGAELSLSQTTGIVDLDAVLDSLDKPARTDLQHLIRGSAEIYAGSGAPAFNAMLGKLNPAVGQLQRATGELAYSRRSLDTLIDTAATSARAIASRRADLRDAVANTATSLAALADQDTAISDALTRAPGVLRQAQGTLAGVDDAVAELAPTLRAIPPAAVPLGQFLRQTQSTLHTATPVIADLRNQLPGLQRALLGFPALQAPAVTALQSTARASRAARHIVRGIRIYGSDFILGVFNGLAGIATGNYNRTGHYARLEFVQNLQTLFGGAFANVLPSRPLADGIINVRTHLDARCPGGNAPPSADGSSPWIPDTGLCDPGDDMPESVNQP
jgi:phospholipid/cholesterol/gamma-HCH transport system substrate-binding protein